ncbi:MAG TPA: type II toxin-antitoxin system prevent-host-death family antitoxin [Candidatus Sulfotelmatobacter sp.]|nr:type II toxin-antitoxin system prevent-host-death family antitoxin [Candidatus Sulfotelmatobacter sp.]
MKTVGAFEAKTHLNELLRQVLQGETIRITRRGIPVAKLVPAEDGEPKDLKQIVRDIREIRKGANLRGLTIRKLIDEGRRY